MMSTMKEWVSHDGRWQKPETYSTSSHLPSLMADNDAAFRNFDNCRDWFRFITFTTESTSTPFYVVGLKNNTYIRWKWAKYLFLYQLSKTSYYLITSYTKEYKTTQTSCSMMQTLHLCSVHEMWKNSAQNTKWKTAPHPNKSLPHPRGYTAVWVKRQSLMCALSPVLLSLIMPLVSVWYSWWAYGASALPLLQRKALTWNTLTCTKPSPSEIYIFPCKYTLTALRRVIL